MVPVPDVPPDNVYAGEEGDARDCEGEDLWPDDCRSGPWERRADRWEIFRSEEDLERGD